MIYSCPLSWYNGVYKDTAEPRPSGRSYTLENGFYRAVLLVHGYAGYPGELVSVANYLYANCFDVYVPRLPGMGTSGKDFKASGLSDWLTVVDNAITELSMKYDELYGFGHSMGCLLLASQDRGRLKRAVMAAPALKMKNPLNRETREKLVKEGNVLDLEWHNDPSFHLHYDNAPADDEYYGAEYWSKLYPSQLNDLYDISYLTRDNFFDNRRYMVLYGNQDQICIFPKSVLDKVKNKTLIKNGTHYLVYDRDPNAELETLKATLKFLNVRRKSPRVPFMEN